MIDIKALKKPKCLTCCKEKDYGGDRIQSIVESILIDSDKEE